MPGKPSLLVRPARTDPGAHKSLVELLRWKLKLSNGSNQSFCRHHFLLNYSGFAALLWKLFWCKRRWSSWQRRRRRWRRRAGPSEASARTLRTKLAGRQKTQRPAAWTSTNWKSYIKLIKAKVTQRIEGAKRTVSSILLSSQEERPNNRSSYVAKSPKSPKLKKIKNQPNLIELK